MKSVFADSLSEILKIISEVPSAIWNEIFFPPRPKSFEDHLRLKVKGQHSTIRSQDGNISYLHRKVRELDYLNRDQKQLLIQKDKELKQYEQKVHSLEFRLRNGSH